MFHIKISGITEMGSMRKENQDALVMGGIVAFVPGTTLSFNIDLHADKYYIAAVVDGLGGYEGGKEAAGITALGLAGITEIEPMNMESPKTAEDGDSVTYMPTNAAPTENDLKGVCANIGRRIATAGRAWGTPSMGAAFAALCFTNDGFISFNVGDCRSYRFMGGSLIQTSVDDKSPQSKALTQALSDKFQEYEIHYNSFKYKGRGERFLICSDGLNGALSNEELRELIATKKNPDAVRRDILELLYTRTTNDNFTFVLIDVEKGK